MAQLIDFLRKEWLSGTAEEKGERLSFELGAFAFHDCTDLFEAKLDRGIAHVKRGTDVRTKIINRQRIQHALVLAHLLFALCMPALAAKSKWRAWGEPGFSGDPAQDRPLLVVVGHPTSHRWRLPDHSFFSLVILDRDAYPQAGEAYSVFANLLGASGDPVYVILTPHLEPVAAIGPGSNERLKVFLDDIAARWGSDRQSLLEAAGLAVRQYALNASARETGNEDLRALVRSARYDHIGGGFFRGTRDERMPFFDKSLFDQVFYANRAVELWRETRAPLFADVTQATLEYVLSELRDPEGSFLAGQNADSLVALRGPRMSEGGHYLWQQSEIRHLLGDQLSDIVSFYYGIAPEGNLTGVADPAGDFTGLNLPLPVHSDQDTRARFVLSEQELNDALALARRKLYDARSKRPDPMPHPLVVTGYNGLAISALARAGMAFDEPRYIEGAVRAAKAVLKKNYDAERKNLRRTDRVAAMDQDYAFFIRGLLDAYNTSLDLSLLDRAIEMQKQQDAAGSSTAPAPVAALLSKDPFIDEVTSMNRAALGALLGNEQWLKAAGEAAVAKQRQIVIVGNPGQDDTKALLHAARRAIAPGHLLFLAGNDRTRGRLATWFPILQEIDPKEKAAVATVCQLRSCRTLTSDPQVLAAWLQ